MEKNRCLVLLPIGVTRRQESPTFLAIYEHVLLPALRAIGIPLDILRGDEVMRSGLSLSEGQRWLQEPVLVIADLTTAHSGVIHDLTLRRALLDRTIIITQEPQDMPRQFLTYRQIHYELSTDGVAYLQQALQHHVSEILCVAVPPDGTAQESKRHNRQSQLRP